MTTRNLAAAASLAALTSLPTSPVHAVNLTTPASVCRPDNTDIASLAVHEVSPVYTSNADPENRRMVLCPIARFGDNNGVTVLIRGHTLAIPSAPLTCTVYSYRPGDGGHKSIRLRPPAGSSNFVMAFTFTAEEAPANGHLNALCELSPERSAQGRLFHFQTVD